MSDATHLAGTTGWPGRYWRAARHSFLQIGEQNLTLISAGVAFFLMLSLFPALAALIAVLGLISDPAVVVAQLEAYRSLLPSDVFDIVNTQVVGLVSTSSDKLSWAGIISLLAALWSTRAGVGAMMNGLNAVYGEENRPSWRHYLSAIGLSLGLIGVGLIALFTVIVAPVILSFVPLGGLGYWVAEVLRWSIAIGVLLGGIGVLYRYGPNRRGRRIGFVSPGGLFAALSWAALSVGFSYYVANFGNYNQVYGSIGAVIAMLVWLWLSSFLVLLGGAFNAALEREETSQPQ